MAHLENFRLKVFRAVAEHLNFRKAAEQLFLTLGASRTIAQYVLPRLLGAFQNEYPKIQFSLHSGNTSEVARCLLDGKVALGLIEGPARERGVRTEPFMEDELILIARMRKEKTVPARHISQDHLGMLWLSTLRGLFRFACLPQF